MATVTINTDANANEWAEFNISQVNTDNVNLIIGTEGNTGTLEIDWGDGNIDAGIVPHNTNQINHVYVGNANLLRIRCTEGLEHIRIFFNLSMNIEGNVSIYSIFPKLTDLNDYGGALDSPVDVNDVPKQLFQLAFNNIDVTGLAANLPPNLQQFTTLNSPSFSLQGDISTFPKSLTYIVLRKAAISGDIINLPPNLTRIELEENTGTITGNIATLPNTLEQIRVNGPNTINGDINTISSNMVLFFIFNGSNTISGRLENLDNNVEFINIKGNNIIEGDLSNISSSNLNSIQIEGNNTIEGNLSDINGININTFIIKGNNTITGNIDNINIDSIFQLYGNNTVNGDIGNIPSANIPVNFFIGGNHDLRRTTAYTPLAALGTHIFQLDSAGQNMPESEIDDIIGDLEALSGSMTVGFVSVGVNRTAASDADVASIQGNGGYVTIII